MKVVSLITENIKRIRAVEIIPTGNMVQITGRNGQGKTSILDSLFWVAAGAKNIQDEPIRKGQKEARIRLDCGEAVLTRTFKTTKDGNEFTTSLKAEGPAVGGMTAQAFADKIIDALSFDPLLFKRADAAAQFKMLSRFVPNVDFDGVARANKADYDSRGEINKMAKQSRAAAEQIVIPAGTPDAPVDTAVLAAKLADAGTFNADIETRRKNRAVMAAKINERQAAIDKDREEIARIQAGIDAAAAQNEIDKNRLATAPPLPSPIDTTEVQAQIANSAKINEFVSLRKRRDEYGDKATELESKSAELTARMEARTAAKNSAIAAAKMPVDGIGFGDGIVTLAGMPFAQGSDAEQLRASIAIAMAGNPELRVIRVRDGSLLDDQSMSMLAAMAADRDYQVWIERVDGSGTVGFVIEDGALKVQPDATAVPAAAPARKGPIPTQAAAENSVVDDI